MRRTPLVPTAVVFALTIGWIDLAARQPVDRIVATEHQVTAGGRTLRYTARAGTLPILDNETGEIHARMFFVSYTMAREAGDPPRPLTFLWNGGPGASSSLVHLLGFGPRRIGPPGQPIDNDGTWLDFSDLVFVDPVGTGYSRPVKAEYGPGFYQARGDAESVAEFIRVYRNRFDAHDAPLFLAGESYGVTRAAGVADALERRGTRVSGAILIGLTLPLGRLTAEETAALIVPTYAASAFAHWKLGRDLQADLQATLRKAEEWSRSIYLPALQRRDALTDADRGRVAADLARHTGFDLDAIDRRTLTIPMAQFSERLLHAEGLMAGRYDSRLTAPFDPEQVRQYDPTKDPSLRNILDTVAVVRYLRSELEYQEDLNYQGPFGGGYPPPTAFRGDWMSVGWNWREAPDPEALSRAMTGNAQLAVFSTCGLYDLVCSYFANQYAAEAAGSLGSRVQVRAYGGGHAIYAEDSVRTAMKRDVAAFVQAATRVAEMPAAAPRQQADSRAPESSRDAGAVTTRHQVSVGGRPLRYTTRAGTLPIRVNETGDTHGHVFYVAYMLDAPAASPRPLTFLWNGGPGSNSSLLHLSGFGPRRLRTARDATSSSCECELQDNEATWLAHSDLVFVDPIGTGFSRPVLAEYGDEFYSTLGDIASIAEFVRVYLTRFDAWDAPLFLAGESYGAWRASGVAEALERRGLRVAGVMLISGGIQLGPVIDEEMRTALFVPTRAAAALHHGRLGADLQQDHATTLGRIEAWARDDYGPALRRLADLTATERESLAAALARYTGLNAGLIDRQTLVVSRQQFAEQLLGNEQRVLARFDTREVEGPRPRTGRREAINRYLRSTLGYRTDLAYEGAEEGFAPAGQPARSVSARWNYNQAPEPPAGSPPRPSNLDGPPGGPQPWLRRALAMNPSIGVFVAAGLYDSLNSCAANAYLVSQVEPSLRPNITARCYEGGHTMYEAPAVRLRMTQDVAAFIRDALAGR
jgi:carboxypeptidase C (cathepsin A)